MIALKKYFNKVIGGVDPDNLPKGMVIRNNVLRINGKELFDLYQTYGLPIEIAQEIMKEWGVAFDEQTMKEAEEALKEHQKLSHTSSAGMFKQIIMKKQSDFILRIICFYPDFRRLLIKT